MYFGVVNSNTFKVLQNKTYNMLKIITTRSRYSRNLELTLVNINTLNWTCEIFWKVALLERAQHFCKLSHARISNSFGRIHCLNRIHASQHTRVTEKVTYYWQHLTDKFRMTTRQYAITLYITILMLEEFVTFLFCKIFIRVTNYL